MLKILHQTPLDITFTKYVPCVVCPLAKQRKLPFLSNVHTYHNVFELIHCEVWGPMTTFAMDSSCYFLTIVDDYN